MEKVQYCHTADLTDGGGSLKIILLPTATTYCFCLTFLLSMTPPLCLYLYVCVCARHTLTEMWCINVTDISISEECFKKYPEFCWWDSANKHVAALTKTGAHQ